ncbi:MAG: response regulator, partial [Spirochaetaceae bacterium]|nr:response regulator [Spirochaetaceae bacterium]
LVVDDDESLLGFLATMLGKAGAEVSSALNGGEALLKAESVPFDICVIDINLPGINGISLYERLSVQHKQRCVFITGRLDVEVQVPQGIPLLQKPFTPQALINAIKGQLASVI